MTFSYFWFCSTAPIAYSGGVFSNETKLELLLQKNIKHGNPLHAIAATRWRALGDTANY